MFIVWGRKLVYRKLGHVADFCPICRKPRPFALQRIGSAGHVYYCRIPDDYISKNRYPLFMARAVMRGLIESLQSLPEGSPC